MTMLDHLLQILSPQNDKIKKSGCNNNNVKKSKTRKNKKPKPVVKEEQPYLNPDLIRPTPENISLYQVVHLPPKIDQREWVATQVISLFHNINLEYGTMSEFCTADTCPTMQGAGQIQYLWLDDRGKKLKCTAPQYIDYVMTYCQKCVSNEKLFPTKYAQTFGESFYADISKVLRFLFHVLSHMYSAHFTHLHKLSMHGHLNIIFMHFVLLVREFELLDSKDLEPLKELIDLMQISKNMCMEVPSKSSLQSSSPSTSNGSRNPLSHGSANAQTSYNTFSSGQFVPSFGRSSGLMSTSKSYVTS